jgi:hypothetical protein
MVKALEDFPKDLPIGDDKRKKILCVVPWDILGIPGSWTENTCPTKVSKCLVILGEVWDHVVEKDLVSFDDFIL